MTSASPHIVFSGGGTGGHLFPGLAVAEQLVGLWPGTRITFAGSGKPFERRLVAEHGFDYLPLRCQPSPKSARETVAFVFSNLSGFLAANRFIRQQNVSAVVGLGGYASVPMGRAASQQRCPLLLLEQNAVPGRATRWLARRANAICLAMPAAREQLPAAVSICTTGNPVRNGFSVTDPTQRQLLVLGGSGGARSLNQNVPKALYRLRSALIDWRVVHQTGEADAAATAELYGKLAIRAKVVAFIDDMSAVLRRTGAAVCRAGGTTLAEFAAAGVPPLLLPYPHAVDDHQRRNAEVFCRAGGAVMLDEREVAGRLDHALADALQPIVSDASLRAKMSLVMQRFARPQAASDVAQRVLELAVGRSIEPAHARAA
jgi:UDP-N-acetylglucosamine--N-acetylmuramyl-(pentapeptide) pyrophosphoryl-undecaprenol N-acetylglucosamine transferase